MRRLKIFQTKMLAALLAGALGTGACGPDIVQVARAESLQMQQYVQKSGETQSRGIFVETPTQAEIIQRAKTVKKISPVFAEKPVTTAPYSAGKLSAETLQNAVDVLNLVRFIAGVPDQVTINQKYTQKAQAASLVNFVNDQMSHTPAKPADMEESIYQLGAAGAGESNLGCGWGSGNLYADGDTFFDAIIHGWMDDGDASNISCVGHRRWVINPSMTQTGFGMVYGSRDGWNSFQDAMYAFDNSFGKTNYYGVAWPAQNMPVSFFDKSYPWSISMGKEVSSDVSVVLTRRGDGKKWSFKNGSRDFYIDNENYGQPGCIIFRPSGIEGYKAGDVFDVSIAGTGLDVQYTVTFFSLEGNAPAATPKARPTATPKATPVATPVIVPKTPVPVVTSAPTEYPVKSPDTTRVPWRTPSVINVPTEKPVNTPDVTKSPEEILDDIFDEFPFLFPTESPYAADDPMPTEVPAENLYPTESPEGTLDDLFDDFSFWFPTESPAAVPTGTPLPTEKPVKNPQATATPAAVPDSNLSSDLSSEEETEEEAEAEDEEETIGYVIPPKAVSVTSAKNKKGRKIALVWKKIAGVYGYQVEYALNKKFSKGKKSFFTKGTSITIGNLKKKNYYVRICAHKKSKGVKVQGAWSAVKKVKVKK